MTTSRRPLSEAERLDWLRLARTDAVGPITFHDLIARYGSAGAAIQALPELSRRGGRRAELKPPSVAEARRELDALARIGGRLVAACEPDYPGILAMIEDAPPVLSLLGRGELAARPMVGIVGARNASLNGRRFAHGMARQLGEAGFTVVSGFARGIDTAAHEGALATGTLAVLAGGIDIIYPPENAGLYDRLAESGLVVAECALGTQPTARHFPRRNRLISGLSLGVVVIEAALRSGSLITARMAAEQGRQVLAVPGSPLDPRAQGCNRLIRGGATLVESAEHVIEALAPQISSPLLREPPPAPRPSSILVPEGADGAGTDRDRAMARVLELLSPTPTAVDELLRDCQLSPPVVLTVLLELELAGRIERQPGNRISLL
ncbi:DNA-processing protein DprA [Inquilinus limosus]|uniref:DNA processing protein DprA n=1 Tax=Inquilinus limosus MP06 TaxID=1398085 RepID=A0A0A0D561_9PROT|nr:DNA-processing protein DprA [Inquilinus limosus]KGM32202.1 DNA processing protein DprA [Inquilinus limosus MP06]